MLQSKVARSVNPEKELVWARRDREEKVQLSGKKEKNRRASTPDETDSEVDCGSDGPFQEDHSPNEGAQERVEQLVVGISGAIPDSTVNSNKDSPVARNQWEEMRKHVEAELVEHAGCSGLEAPDRDNFIDAVVEICIARYVLVGTMSSIREGPDINYAAIRAVVNEVWIGGGYGASDSNVPNDTHNAINQWIASVSTETGLNVGFTAIASGLKMSVATSWPSSTEAILLSVQGRLREGQWNIPLSINKDSIELAKVPETVLTLFLARRPPKGKGLLPILQEAYDYAKAHPKHVTVKYEVDARHLPSEAAAEVPRIQGALDSLRISFANYLSKA